MTARVAGPCPVFLLAITALPARAQDSLELPLTSLLQRGSDRSPTVSLGSVGLDSRAGNSYKPAPGGDPYYFMVPNEQPPKKAPGITIKIPLWNGRSE
jgi:hypothetical protein